MACLASVVITHMCPDSSGIGALPWVVVRSLAVNVELAAGVLTLVDLIGRCVCVRIVDQPPSGSTRPRDGGRQVSTRQPPPVSALRLVTLRPKPLWRCGA